MYIGKLEAYSGLGLSSVMTTWLPPPQPISTRWPMMRHQPRPAPLQRSSAGPRLRPRYATCVHQPPILLAWRRWCRLNLDVQQVQPWIPTPRRTRMFRAGCAALAAGQPRRGALACGRGVAVGGTGVSVGGMGVSVGGMGVSVGGMGVSVGGTGVSVGGTGVGVSVAGTGVGMAVSVGKACLSETA